MITSFAPELQVILISGITATVAYFGIYPSFRDITLTKVMVGDLVVTCALLLVVGGLFWGSGVGFSLVLFEVNWLIFTIVIFSLMELPLFFWLSDKYDLL